jgi:hypothetical protein
VQRPCGLGRWRTLVVTKLRKERFKMFNNKSPPQRGPPVFISSVFHLAIGGKININLKIMRKLKNGKY